jgi:hypothetical protein
MNVPRNTDADRPFSTSWGRSAYICAARQMEQNPLYVFKGSCFGKQSVESSLNSAKEYFTHPAIAKKVSVSSKRKNDNSFDLKYGTVDINTIDDYINEGSIDFIITDPPYGGLVQYLDLSYIWLVWLKEYDSNLEPNFNPEITIKNGIVDEHTYQRRFTGGLKKLFKLLKDDGKLVLTFHNKDINVWNSFLAAIRESGFIIEPAGVLSLCALDIFADEIKGKTAVSVISGGNSDVFRMPEILERSLAYEGLKHYFKIQFAQKAGSLKNFILKVLGSNDDIIYFRYTRTINRETGPAIIGLQVRYKDDIKRVIQTMNELGIEFKQLDGLEDT